MSNNFQELFYRLAEVAKAEHLADKPIITLGTLRTLLESAPKDYPVKISFQGELYNYSYLESYRGYYSDLSLSLDGADDISHVQKVLDDLNRADGDTFEGYKGGEYDMNSDTLMWADFYGSCYNQGVTGIIVSDDAPGVSAPLVIIQTGDCE